MSSAPTDPTNATDSADGIRTAWVKLYHASGVDVRLPIRMDGKPVEVEAFAAVLASIGHAIEAGFQVTQPGLEPGETKQTAGALVVRKGSQEGSWIVDVYAAGAPEVNRYKFLKLYLDTPEQIEDFETLAGVKLHNVPLYNGTGDIERGKNRQLDQLVITQFTPFNVVHRPNPRYNPAETDKTKIKPARLLVRLEALNKKQREQAGGPGNALKTEQAIKALHLTKTEAEFNSCWGQVEKDQPEFSAGQWQQVQTARTAVRKKLGLDGPAPSPPPPAAPPPPANPYLPGGAPAANATPAKKEDRDPEPGPELAAWLFAADANCYKDGITPKPGVLTEHVKRSAAAKGWEGEPQTWPGPAVGFVLHWAREYYKVHKPAPQTTPATIRQLGTDKFGDGNDGFDRWLAANGIPEPKFLDMVSVTVLGDLREKLSKLRV